MLDSVQRLKSRSSLAAVCIYDTCRWSLAARLLLDETWGFRFQDFWAYCLDRSPLLFVFVFASASISCRLTSMWTGLTRHLQHMCTTLIIDAKINKSLDPVIGRIWLNKLTFALRIRPLISLSCWSPATIELRYVTVDTEVWRTVFSTFLLYNITSASRVRNTATLPAKGYTLSGWGSIYNTHRGYQGEMRHRPMASTLAYGSSPPAP